MRIPIGERVQWFLDDESGYGTLVEDRRDDSEMPCRVKDEETGRLYWVAKYTLVE